MNSQKDNRKAYALLANLMIGLVRQFDFNKFPDRIFFFKGKEVFFAYDFNREVLYCRDGKVWARAWQLSTSDELGVVKRESVSSFIKQTIDYYAINQIWNYKACISPTSLWFCVEAENYFNSL